MKLAIITDTHCGARNDSQAFADYFDKFYYNTFFPYLEEHNIDTIIHLGDLMDKRKTASYTSVVRFNKFFQTVVDNKLNLHWILGNHDCYYKSTNSVNAARELLGSHNSLGTQLFFYEDATSVTFDGLELAFIPWICSENYNRTMSFIDSTKAQVLMGHLDINGFEMYKGMVNDHGYSRELYQKFDIVMSGHFHHKSSYQNIHYLGSPFEITWSDWNDPRGFHIFDTDTRELTYIENPYKMFHKLYYDDSNVTFDELIDFPVDTIKDSTVKLIVINKTNPYWFDQYTSKIEKAGILDLQIVEDNLHLDLIDDLDENVEDTLTILRKYSEQYKDRVNQADLNKFLQELYQEALTIE